MMEEEEEEEAAHLFPCPACNHQAVCTSRMALGGSEPVGWAGPGGSTLFLGLKHHSGFMPWGVLASQPGVSRAMAVVWMSVATSVLRITPTFTTQQLFTCVGHLESASSSLVPPARSCVGDAHPPRRPPSGATELGQSLPGGFAVRPRMPPSCIIQFGSNLLPQKATLCDIFCP